MTPEQDGTDLPLVETRAHDQLSPFAYVAAEEAQRDRQATDAVFLGFNVDLSFLEARLLGLCHAAGAAVTVIGDADAWSPDVRSVRFAGRQYHVGLVAATNAFHPKLTLLAGPERAVAIIGSGNLTLGGWQYNAEILTVLRADRTAAPRVLADLRDVLVTLPGASRLDPLAQQGLQRCSRHLEALMQVAEIVDTGHRLVASWDEALIDILPHGPVDELLLSAPFYDPAGSAVRALLDRLQPQVVRIAVQPGWTTLEPMNLAAVLDAYAEQTRAEVEVIRDQEDPDGGRYRHGKLIEWTVDSTRSALTGSPNLSVAALLKRAQAQGNYEIAVIGPTDASLFPPGAPVDLRSVPPIRIDRERPASELASPIITAVIDRDGGVTLHLARISRSVQMEVSQLTDQPDRWHAVTELDAGSEIVDVDLDTTGGSRIRLTWADADGTRRWSAAHFVTDRRAAVARRGISDRRSRSHRTQPSDLWGDDLSFLDAVMGDLSAIASELAARTSAAAMASRDGGDQESEYSSTGADDHHVEPWLWIQTETLARLGPGLAPYALALPSLGALDSWEPEWVDAVVPDNEEGLENDTAETLQNQTAQDETTDTDPVDQRNDSEYLRGRRRSWCEKATRMENLPIEVRLFVLLVTLRLWQTGNWPESDLRSIQLISRQVEKLDLDEVPGQLAARVGSLSAIAVALMRGAVDARSHNERTLLYNDMARRSKRHLALAEAELTERYLKTLVPQSKIGHWIGEIDDCIDAATTNDPFGDIDDDLALDYIIRRPGVRMLHLEGNLSNPAQRALEVIGQVEDRTGVAVWASNLKGDWALVVWKKPDLVTVTKTGTTRIRWRHQLLTGLVGPASLARQTRLGDSQSHYDIVTKPKFWRTDEAVAVLESVGITDPSPPSPDP